MPTSSKQNIFKRLKKSVKNQKKRLDAFLNRRPHRSFRMTRRRDYIRPLVLPGNFAFTGEVSKLLWKYRKMFALLVLVYVSFFAILVGIQSQDNYSIISETLSDTSGDAFSGNVGALGQAGLLLVSVFSNGLGGELTEAQQIFSGLIFILTWLTTVWLIRNILAGHKVKLRDGLYNSGAPLISTMLVALLIAVQLLPIAIASLAYSAALGSGLLDGGVASMLFWLAAALLAVLSLYWITSSLFAMIIITLPGMYPYKAIKTAGDIMVGRRIKLLLRWIWMAAVVIVASLVVMIPIILIDMGIKNLWPAVEWMPIVPIALLLWSAISTVWMATYVYLLYRKVVDYVPR